MQVLDSPLPPALRINQSKHKVVSIDLQAAQARDEWGADPVVIVINIKAFVCPDVALAFFALLRRRANKAPHRQIIHKQLIPAERKRNFKRRGEHVRL